jgi:hypothetical protein
MNEGRFVSNVIIKYPVPKTPKGQKPTKIGITAQRNPEKSYSYRLGRDHRVPV